MILEYCEHQPKPVQNRILCTIVTVHGGEMEKENVRTNTILM